MAIEQERPSLAGEPGENIELIPMPLTGLNPEELGRIIDCQIGAGREICLMIPTDGVLKPRIFDLRGIADLPEEETIRDRTRIIEAMARSVIMFVVRDG
ncbi:hypothetical protein M1307_00130 [Patescibacteria group bacterium]|nr:hypothetical protein [Patescibacteria group bacterium]MCL5970233.1 hypothetical protein [Patescibacteria group bacterium]